MSIMYSEDSQWSSFVVMGSRLSLEKQFHAKLMYDIWAWISSTTSESDGFDRTLQVSYSADSVASYEIRLVIIYPLSFRYDTKCSSCVHVLDSGKWISALSISSQSFKPQVAPAVRQLVLACWTYQTRARCSTSLDSAYLIGILVSTAVDETKL